MYHQLVISISNTRQHSTTKENMNRPGVKDTTNEPPCSRVCQLVESCELGRGLNFGRVLERTIAVKALVMSDDLDGLVDDGLGDLGSLEVLNKVLVGFLRWGQS